MANTLTTALVAPLTKMIAEALRQEAGLIQSITVDQMPDLGFGQSKTLPRVGDLTVSNFTPSVNAPTQVDTETLGNTLTMSNRKQVLFNLTGEEAAGLKYNADAFVAQQAAEAVNEAVQHVEDAVRTNLAIGCGYAALTGGTNPYDSTGKLDVLSKSRVILSNAGVSKMDRSAILGSDAAGRYLDLDSNNKVNESGDMNIRREGSLGRTFGFGMRETNNSASFIKSSATGYLTDGAASKGDRTITVDTGSNNFAAGDILTIATASFKYVVKSFNGSTVITLNAPLLEDIATNSAITVETSDDRDFVVGKSALMLAIRPDRLADGEIRGADSTIITDPVSGVSMRLSQIPGVGMTQFQLSFVYGTSMWVEEAGVIVPSN